MATELERARLHLQSNQINLAAARVTLVARSRGLALGPWEKGNVRFWEGQVLAALSWVWDAQERQRSAEMQRYYDFKTRKGFRC